MPAALKFNVGSADRLVRFVLGLALIAIALIFRAALGPIGMGAGVAVGAVLMVTAALRFCPAYKVVGLSTCRSEI